MRGSGKSEMLLDEMDCLGDCSTFCTSRIFAEAAFAMAFLRDLTMGDLYKNMFPHWQKEIIHGMIEFVVVGIVSISA